ncbi:ABC transporter ATP-binding protein [Fontibacillus sp. BL9]|uniref:ABC transporter ATP-binding protein n=1 Tax=Fontibacillus sp. BL9 TaxID=3389971 RepID=UPI00397CB7EC
MGAFFSKLLTLTFTHRKWISIYLAAALIVVLCDVTVGYLIKTMSDSAFDSLHSIWKITGLFVTAAVLGGGCKYLARYAGGYFGNQVIRDLRNRISSHISHLPISSHSQIHTGDFVSRTTNDINQLQLFLQTTFFQIAYQPLVFLITISYLLYLNAKLILVTLLIVPIAVFVANIISKPIKKNRTEESEVEAQVLSIVQDSISGVTIEKAFNLQQILVNKFSEAVKKSTRLQLKREKRQALLTPFEIIIRIIPLLVCSVYGGYLAVHHELSPGELFAFLFLINYLVEPLAIIPESLGQLRISEASLNRLEQFLELPMERQGGQTLNINYRDALLSFIDVSFQYTEDAPVLKCISFNVKQNQKIAIVGSSGSGKSTIFHLLCGHYQPTEGSIEYMGEDLNKLDLEQVRTMISIVSQDTFLFPGTIAENISYGCPEASFEEIVKAAQTACIHEFIMDQPQGYQTMIGERAFRLSGGQKQRISIARAILKNAPVLLFDEATSALDSETEFRLQQHLHDFMKDRTVLIIAHRLTTILQADEILVLHQGVIVERGNHEYLSKYGGRYQELYRHQFSDEPSWSV